MTGRRELLFGVAGSHSVAGCLGSVGDGRGLAQVTAEDDSDPEPVDPDATDDSDDDGSDDDSETDSTSDPPEGLPGMRVENIELSFAPHVGLRTLITLQTESTEGYDRADLVTKAYDSDDSVLAEASSWEDVPPQPKPVLLEMDNIFDLYGNLGSITEFVIKGRVPDGEYGELRSFSGGAFREEVGVEGGGETESDTDVEVDVEDEDETESEDSGDEATNETDTGGTPTDDGGNDESDDGGGGSLADELDVDF